METESPEDARKNTEFIDIPTSEAAAARESGPESSAARLSQDKKDRGASRSGTSGSEGAPAPSRPTPRTANSQGQDSFHTAYSSASRTRKRQRVESLEPVAMSSDAPAEERPGDQPSTEAESSVRTDTDQAHFPGETTSTSSLLPRDGKGRAKGSMSKAPLKEAAPQQVSIVEGEVGNQQRGVRFMVADKLDNQQENLRMHLQKHAHRPSMKRLRRKRLRDGEIVKMERMLVRVDTTVQELSDDYNENDSLKTESRTIEKWREFVVVCRQSSNEDAEYVLQMYKTRVIPEIEPTEKKKKSRSTHEIPLGRKSAKVNLYSSLDKTVVLWVPSQKATRIYILRPRSLSHAAEWYTFLRDLLGWDRPNVLQVNVPDLSVSLRLQNPFKELEESRDRIKNTESDDPAFIRTMMEEQAVAARIIKRCMDLLETSPEWANVLEAWTKTEKMGLAWKRYDRLEWISGQQEQKMYGTMAMQHSHELELRPKQHYPTHVHPSHDELMDEPPPVEGFLIRLTSQKGIHQRLGKMFFKRLYFSTHNQFLCFCRPARAKPPPPPKLPMKHGKSVPTSEQIVESTPIVYAVDPYRLNEDKIDWLDSGKKEFLNKHDENAELEADRTTEVLGNSDGYINLCNVLEVREISRGASPADSNIEQGEDAEFHQEVPDTRRDDGKVKNIDDYRTFELLLKNGLVVRLQTYDATTKKEWMSRLDALVKYWKIRTRVDMDLLKSVRRENLEKLGVNEEQESFLGQFAQKWEVQRSQASPQLYNMCGISGCRSIIVSINPIDPILFQAVDTSTQLSGLLYRKPRRHSTFVRCNVILSRGRLLIFQGSLRKRSGEVIPHIHQERQQHIELRDCYIYSGLLTDNDLLYQNQTFDSNNPGHHALPRVYLEDGWTSSDEDTMTCFVLWHTSRRSFFRTNEEQDGGGTRQKLKTVSRLGVPGKSMVFKTRSRAERDHWVMAIGLEIERLQQEEEIRLEKKKKE